MSTDSPQPTSSRFRKTPVLVLGYAAIFGLTALLLQRLNVHPLIAAPIAIGGACAAAIGAWLGSILAEMAADICDRLFEILTGRTVTASGQDDAQQPL